jgi:hypothetical protein
MPEDPGIDFRHWWRNWTPWKVCQLILELAAIAVVWWFLWRAFGGDVAANLIRGAITAGALAYIAVRLYREQRRHGH